MNGVLTGLGWDSDVAVDRNSECGDILAFPPDSPGNYTGDVDWIGLTPSDDGVLCMEIETDEVDARMDAILYTLDDCDEPTALFVNPDTETPLGLDHQAGLFSWAISVKGGQRLGLGVAGFWPDEAETEIVWEVRLALVPGVSGTADALCPEAS